LEFLSSRSVFFFCGNSRNCTKQMISDYSNQIVQFTSDSCMFPIHIPDINHFLGESN
jgi:hypothetical protein